MTQLTDNLHRRFVDQAFVYWNHYQTGYHWCWIPNGRPPALDRQVQQNLTIVAIKILTVQEISESNLLVRIEARGGIYQLHYIKHQGSENGQSEIIDSADCFDHVLDIKLKGRGHSI